MPTASVTRQTEAGGPEPPVTFCMGGCKGANEICVGNQNNPQTIDDESESSVAVSIRFFIMRCSHSYAIIY